MKFAWKRMQNVNKIKTQSTFDRQQQQREKKRHTPKISTVALLYGLATLILFSGLCVVFFSERLNSSGYLTLIWRCYLIMFFWVFSLTFSVSADVWSRFVFSSVVYNYFFYSTHNYFMRMLICLKTTNFFFAPLRININSRVKIFFLLFF